MTPWTDRSGKFSPLKAFTLAMLCLPALLLALSAARGTLAPSTSLGPLGARPITEAIHETGDWAIRFLLLSLAVTPLRRIANWPKLIMVRRMIGLATLFYALSHLVLYSWDLKFDLVKIIWEIVQRFYLTIGFVALVGLGMMGATSTDAAIRRLGKNWARLHKIVYVIGVLAALHFFMQSKINVYEPTLMGGLFILLMLYRLAHWRGIDVKSPLVIVCAACIAGLATAGTEYAWYGIATGIPPERVLAANLQFSFSIRPAWWVFAVGLALAAVALLRPYFGKEDARPRSRRAATAA